jgi:hypothetical protein
MNYRAFTVARLLGAVMALALTPGATLASDAIPAFQFASVPPGSPLPAEWKVLALDSRRPRTVYTLVQDSGRTVLRAEANASASALSRSLHVDPGSYPVLRWRWKITNLLERSDLRRKNGDDFPARLYVFFDYDSARLPLAQRAKLALARALYGDAMPLAALCYVWDTRSPVGSVAPNAYTDRVAMIVVESGAAHLGQWVDAERNVVADFKAAFGEDAPAITGIAVAADTDDTGERAVSFFGDIAFGRTNAPVSIR